MKKERLFHQVLPDEQTGASLITRLLPYVRHCGDSYREPWHIGTRKLLDYLIVYIEYGEGVFTVNGNSFTVQEHDLFFIPPDTLHELKGTSEAMHCIYVHFDLVYDPKRIQWDFSIPGGMIDLTDVIGCMHPPCEIGEIREIPYKMTGPFTVEAGYYLQQISREADKVLPYSQLIMSSQMVMCLTTILRGVKQNSPMNEIHNDQLELAAENMRKNISQIPAVKVLASQAALSETHFRLLFERKFGCSPRTYHHKMRIRRAKSLMLETSMNLSEIADYLGYATVQNFSRAFKRTEGISPSQWRSIS